MNGFATGIVRPDRHPELVYTTQVSFEEIPEFIERRIINEEPDVILCEDFTITPKTLKNSLHTLHWPIEIRGVSRALARKYDVKFIGDQKVTPAKKLAKDSVLRRVGWYTKPGQHARDAVRHFVLYLANHHQESFERLMSK